MASPTLPPSTYLHGGGRDDDTLVPGIVVVFSGGAPCARVIPIASGPLVLGRDDAGAGTIDDGRVSRRHAQIAFEDRRCVVTDLGSQNGTFVDGKRATAHAPMPAERVLRIGDSLLLPYADVRPFQGTGVRSDDGFVRGPAMQALLEEVARAARSGTPLHVCGENGTGKEGIAQAFHRAGPRAAGSLVAVNCAAIPNSLAEGLLFGAKRGAHSGAEADMPGFVQEAGGGTLFLDEIAELDPQIQAKLLRVLESKEVTPVGSTKSRKVDFALCSATNKDLRRLVDAGAWRQDLYFRVASPSVTLPALRNRPEEIPALIAQELGKLSPVPKMHVSLVQKCLLLPWPGNVRELLTEIRIAAQAALASGNRVEAHHLSPTAGHPFPSPRSEPHRVTPDEPTAPPSDTRRKPTSRTGPEWRRRIEDALRANGGNVAAAARALGMHRNQLRRDIEKFGVTVDMVPSGNDDDDDDGSDGGTD